ncbi:right-handed parallel beta-helix repeat-containing protein [Candidatus Nitrospira salsa]
MIGSICVRTTIFFFIGLVSTLITSTPTISDAATYYVAKTGNDSSSGTQASPFRNIKHGVSKLVAGDTLYVKAGTYYESILSWSTKIPNGTSWNNPVTVAANPGDTVTIYPPGGQTFFWVKDGQAKYLIIDGFTVDGNSQAKHGFKFSDNSRYIRVKNTEVKNATDSGILVSICSGCASPQTAPHNTYHEFINMNIHHNGSTYFDHGLYIETAHNIIEKSDIHHNVGFGVHIYRSTINTADHNTIRHNVAHHNNTSGKWGCGVLVSAGTGNQVYNNTAYENFSGFCTTYRSSNALLYNNIAFANKHYGIYISGLGNSQTTRAYNNTVYKNEGYGIYVGNNFKNATIGNNIVYQNTTEDIYLSPGDQSGTVLSHNLSTNPEFVNKEANDFRLQEGSPAIDNASTINEVTTDYDGIKRNIGTGPDIGAFEFPQVSTDNEPPASPKSVILKLNEN